MKGAQSCPIPTPHAGPGSGPFLGIRIWPLSPDAQGNFCRSKTPLGLQSQLFVKAVASIFIFIPGTYASLSSILYKLCDVFLRIHIFVVGRDP